MASDVYIRFQAESRAAEREIQRLRDEITRLNTQFQSIGRTATQAGGLVDQFGNPLRESAADAQLLTRAIDATHNELQQIAATSLRSADALDKIGDEAIQTTRQLTQLNASMAQSNRSTGVLTAGFGSLRNVLGGLGIAVVTHQLGQLSVNAIQAAASLEQLTRATTQIEGSAEAAEMRMAALIEVANLPGLQLEPLVRYSNRLRAAGIEGQDVDTILLSVGQTIVSLGGSAATAELAMEQLIQAIAAGKVDMRDFRTIIQQIPGFLEAMGDVHGVAANIDGLKEAFDRTGGSIRDLIIPTFEELSKRFEAPPTDSYIVAMDTLENAFNLAQASIGSLFLPTIVEASQGLTAFFEAIRAGVDDVTTLPEPIQEIVRGAMALWEALQNVAEGVGGTLSPPVRELVSQLANLLGGVLELVGALYNGLEPVLTATAQVAGVVVAAVAQLAEHLTLLINGLTAAVNWVSSFWTEEERAAVSTDKLAAATEMLAEAQEKLGASGDVQREKLKALQTEYDETTARIQRYEQRLKDAEAAGISNRSTQQFERLLETARGRITELESEIERLSTTYGAATAALDENATAAEINEARLSDLQTQLASVNQEVENYQERLTKARETAVGETNPAIEQLERRLASAESQASTLQTEIDTLTSTLSASSDDMGGAAVASENYSLALARLQANAEDTRDTLSNTVNIQQLGANYSAAIAASDAYYAALIANAEAALAQEEENSEAYQQIETELFNLRRDQLQAREQLTQDAAKIGESESQKRIATAEAESQAVRAAGEETARALAESQKQQTETQTAEQKRLTDAHETALQEREAAQQASDARLVQNSQEQLEILQNIFQNALPEAVETAYQNIQQQTITHYATLKSQAQTRITDEDALTAELVSLDRQRNAALQDNHREYLQTLASDAKDLLGDRTEAFREASGEILHNWDRTVSEFERRLREADTEAAIREIEGEFTQAQQQMLESLQSVLIELGFTAEQAAEIMKSALQTAEGETDSFADKVISAFKRLGREADRETRRQNREIERSYRELVRDIEGILGSITDFFFDIANDSDIEQAFKNLGSRLGNAVLGEFQQQLAGQIASAITQETAGAGSGTEVGSGGLGLAGLGSIGSVATNPLAIAAAFLAFPAYGAYQKIQDPSIRGSSEFVSRRNERYADPDESSSFNRGQRYQTDATPFNRGQRYRDDIDEAVDEAIDEVVGVIASTPLLDAARVRFVYKPFIENLQSGMEMAGDFFQSAIARDADPEVITRRFNEYTESISDFYAERIEEIRALDRVFGNNSQAAIFELTRQQDRLIQDAENQQRLAQPPIGRSRFSQFQLNQQLQLNRTSEEIDDEYLATFAADDPNRQLPIRGGVPDAATAADPETVSEDALASMIEAINEDVALINASITSIETQIDQASDPQEIAELLAQFPELIRQKYQRLRDALTEQYYAGEITEDTYSASISELESSESAELERQSDQALANTLRAINEDVRLVDASITSIQTQINQLSEPEEIAALLDQIPALIAEKYQKLRETLDEKYAAGEISVDVYNASLSELESNESAEIERHSDEVLANTLRSINEDVQLIDASITSIQTQIDGLSEPEAIAELLNQIPALISEKYRNLRESLDAKYAAGEISTDVYNASLTELTNSESAELERNSDQQLANTIRAINEDVQLIDVSIASIQSQIDQSNDPEEIAALLGELPALITEKYRRLRESLDEKYAAGEISVDVYNASLTQLANSESSETERQSDQVLANALSEIDDDVSLIDAQIDALQLAVSQSDDPEAVAGLLDAIKILIMDKYRRLRERFEELHAAEEISDTAFNAAILSLGTAESEALAAIDTQALNEISEAAREQVDFINGAIDNLRLSIQLTDDPAKIQQILAAIKTLTVARFQILRDELERVRDNLTPEQFQQAWEGLNLGEQLALQNLDTEQFAAISEAAKEQVDFINGSINNLRLAIELTDDPTVVQGILGAIKTLVGQRFDILIQELKDIEENLKPEEFAQSLTGLELGKLVALQNLDTEIANAIPRPDERQTQINTRIDTDPLDAIREEFQRQVNFINTGIENLRTSLELTDDPAKIQSILDSIKTLTRSRFDVLRQELEAIRGTLSTEEFEQALEGLNLGEQLAIENLDAEKFSAISAAAQMQVGRLNGAIENLRLSLQLTDDLTDQQQILDAIKVLTQGRFAILKQELEDIKESLDPADYNQALQGLELGEQLALQNLDTEKFTAISEAAQDQVNLINGSIENLRLSLQLTDDPADTQQILDAIKILTAARFDVLIQELKDIQDNLKPGEFEQALRGLELGKQVALEAIDTEKFATISDEAQKQVAFINGTIENLRLSFQLTDDPTQQQQIIESIKVLTRARFQILRDELEDIRDNLSQEDYNQALTGLNLGEQLAIQNLDTEKFGIISESAQKQVNFINTSIENLRLSLELTDDPTQIQQILDSIKILTRGRFAILRQELEDIRENLSPEEYSQALTGLNLGEQVALQNIDTEKFSAISAEAQKQVGLINGAIDNLRLSLQLTVDPAETQQILDAIKILVGARFDILIQELKDIQENLDPAVFQQSLRGLQLGREVAIRGIDNEGLSNTINTINTDTQAIDNQINTLNSQIENSDDPAEIQSLLTNLQAAITEKYRLQREVLQKQLDAEEITIDSFNAQLGAINLQESQALQQAGSFAAGQLNDIRTTENALIRNAIERSQFNLDRATNQSEFETRQQELLTLTNQYYDAELERINELELSELELQDLREDNQLARVQALERILNITNDVAEAERRAAEIRERADTSRADASRQARLSREDRSISFSRDIEDFFREEGVRGDAEAHAASLSSAIERVGRGIDDLSAEDLAERVFPSFLTGGFPSREQELEQNRVRDELESLIRGEIRGQEDIARQEKRRLEDIRIQEERDLSQQSLITSTDANTEAIIGLTGAITSTSPEVLAESEPIGQATSDPTTDVGIPERQAVDSLIDVSELTDFGVAVNQFSEDIALLTPATDHLIYLTDNVPNFVEMLADVRGEIGDFTVATEGYAGRVADATAQVEALLKNLSNIRGGGGGGSGQPIMLQFPSGAIYEVGNTLAEGVQTGEFAGIGDTGGGGGTT